MNALECVQNGHSQNKLLWPTPHDLSTDSCG